MNTTIQRQDVHGLVSLYDAITDREVSAWLAITRDSDGHWRLSARPLYHAQTERRDAGDHDTIPSQDQSADAFMDALWAALSRPRPRVRAVRVLGRDEPEAAGVAVSDDDVQDQIARDHVARSGAPATPLTADAFNGELGFQILDRRSAILDQYAPFNAIIRPRHSVRRLERYLAVLEPAAG